MSSINTNSSAMNALSTLRGINKNLEETQGRISTGLKVESAKDNAAYFSISESMKSDSSMLKSINEGLTLAANSISTARLGTESFGDLASQFADRVAFAQNSEGGRDEIQAELDALLKQMDVVIGQSTFNGDDLVGASTTNVSEATIAADGTGWTDAVGEAVATYPATKTVVTGANRANATGALTTTSTTFDTVNLKELRSGFAAIADSFGTRAEDVTNGTGYLKAVVEKAAELATAATDAATTMGVAEDTIESQQDFLVSLTDNMDAGVGAMVDADMEEEAARLQALQVQQQLATQSLSIANSAPQNILSLFR